MHSLRIRLKNYRGFADHPAEFVVHEGFTAFVGPNNGGKSSLLRMFYELRPVWEHIVNTNGLLPLLRDSSPNPMFRLALKGLEDQAEVFCNSNTRPLEIDLEALQPRPHAGGAPLLSRLTLTASRPETGQPISWIVTIHWPGGSKPTFVADNITDDVWTDNGRPILDTSPIVEWARMLASTHYVGPFRHVLSAEQEKYFDMDIGATFVANWDQWSNGPIKDQNSAIIEIVDEMKRIFEFDDLEVAATSDRRSLQVRVNRKPYKLRELGGGFSQFIVTLGNAVFAKKRVVLIDEPELGLHPSLQLDFLTALSRHSPVTMFATHSIGLARSAAEHVYAVQKSSTGSRIAEYLGLASLSEFAGEMNFSSYAALGFDAILLVEGVTDVKTVQQWLRLFKREHRVVVLPMGGDNLASGAGEAELRELLRITSNLYALADSERTAPGGAASPVRVDFETLCKAIGIKCALTERRAIENYLSDNAVKAERGPAYRQLAPFEKLGDLPSRWRKRDNWRIAQHMQLSDIDQSDLG